MEFDTTFNVLKSLLGVEPTQTAGRPERTQTVRDSAVGRDRATLSTLAGELSQAAREDVVRPEKIAAVQAALTAGTYDVPASEVSSKIVDAMLKGHK